MIRAGGARIWGLAALFAALTAAAPAAAPFTQVWSAAEIDDNRGIAWADFNGDCLPDLIVVNNMPGTCVRVYRNLGGGAFSLAYTSTQADRCTAVSVADYDGDGRLDFAVSNYSNIPSRVYHNDGGFNFHVAWSEPFAEYSTGIAWGDYDNDGRPDLAINSLTLGGVRIFHNDGGGAFSYAGSVSTPGNAASVAFGDYNKDGFLDLFEGVTGYGSVIYRGNGTPGFVAACTLPWNNNSDVDWADFNKDGSPDLLETEYANVYKNVGGGSFPGIWSGGDTQFGRAADYNGDGYPDIALSQWAPRGYNILQNGGNGSAFTSVQSGTAPGGPVAWGDYDQDGAVDLAVGCFQCWGTLSAGVFHNTLMGFVPPACPGADPTASATATPSLTGTASFSATPSASSTFSVSPTPSLTVTPDNTVTPSVIATLSVSPTPSPTVTPDDTATPSVSATPSVTPTMSLSGTVSPLPSPTVTVTGTLGPSLLPTVSVSPSTLGGAFEVVGAYPNPFQDRVHLVVRMPWAAGLEISVFNVAGEKVTGWHSAQAAGLGVIDWGGVNADGSRCASGTYIVHLVASGPGRDLGDAWARVAIIR